MRFSNALPRLLLCYASPPVSLLRARVYPGSLTAADGPA